MPDRPRSVPDPLPAELESALTRASAARLPADPRARGERLAERIEACLAELRLLADDWIARACTLKRIDPSSETAAEEIAAPIAVARALQLSRRTCFALARGAPPRLPGVGRLADGRRAVHALPALPFDRLLFRGYRCRIAVAEDPLQEVPSHRPGIAVVLGASNVTAIPPADMLTKLVRDGLPVVVKLHPLRAPLLDVLRAVFAPLRDVGCDFVVAGAEAGASLAADPRVTDVHVTGSPATFASLHALNRTRGAPAHLTAELGNVTPVVVVPGRWAPREMRARVEDLTAMLVDNGGCNCVTPRVVVTCRAWDQRAEFVERLRRRLGAIAPRATWHPGTRERWARFTGREPDDPDRLPFTLLDGVDAEADPPGFREEAFAPVVLETALPGADTEDFLERAVAFCNERLAGDLAAMLLAPRQALRTTRPAIDRAVARLRYGTVAIDAWAALAFAWMTTPWGAAPGNTPDDPGSGLGAVHDPWLLRAALQTIVEGPVVPWPVPPWWPCHPRRAAVMRRLLDLTLTPSPRHLLRLGAPALRAGRLG